MLGWLFVIAVLFLVLTAIVVRQVRSLPPPSSKDVPLTEAELKELEMQAQLWHPSDW